MIKQMLEFSLGRKTESRNSRLDIRTDSDLFTIGASLSPKGTYGVNFELYWIYGQNVEEVTIDSSRRAEPNARICFLRARNTNGYEFTVPLQFPGGGDGFLVSQGVAVKRRS
ncbi:hypothetical protein FRB91_009714 [Serendipita sp. 411]|nr:hypothetical protein FRC18_010402 [Serendipita sp. 400]KAG8849674.1 hypothetical protein FRB91_009714 [Serendipita sp. 411]